MDTVNTIRKTERQHYFVRGTFRRFFFPALVSSFWLAVAGVVDSMFVGNAIGTEGLAAISFGQPVYLFYNILSYGFSIGGSIHYAGLLAKGQEKEGNLVFGTVLKLLLATYVATAALGLLFLPQLMRLLGANPADSVTRTYIRTQLIFVPIMFCQGPFYYFVNADNGPALAAAAMTISGLLDTVFSYIFIVRLHLGVAGSVYSTVVGAVVMLTMTGWHIVRKKGALRFTWSGFDRHAVGRAAHTGFATSARYLFGFITMIAVNHILMRLSGPVGVAAFDVVYNLSVLCAAVSDAAAVATEPMVSSYYSERNLGNIRFTMYLSLLWAGGISLVFSVLLAVFSPAASAFFGMDEGLALAYTGTGIRIFSLSILPAFINAAFSAYYQSIQREGLAYLITFLRSLLFYLIALFLCSQKGMDSFWYVFVNAEVGSALVWVPIAMLFGGLLQLKGIDVSRVRTVLIDNTSQDIGAVIGDVQAFFEQNISNPRLNMYIGLTIEEICVSIFDHFRDRMGEIYVQVTAVAGEGGCTIYLRDNAFAFNPFASDTDELDLEAELGLELMGLRIIKKEAKRFFYRRYTGFNTLVIEL